ncbi:MAG TPA: PAS domain S-box protein [Ktedonobacterales bacterium]
MNTHRERPSSNACQRPLAKASPPAPYRLIRLSNQGLRAWLALRLWLLANTFAPQWMPKRWHHPLLGYLAAVLLELAAASLTLLSVYHLPIFAIQGTLMILGIILCAHIWGKGPGFFATLVGAALLEFVVLPSYFPWFLNDVSDRLSVTMFLLVGVSISLVANQSGWTRQQAEEMTRSLREAHARAERERLRLRSLLEVLPAAVGMMDTQGRMVETNLANKTLWGGNAPRPGEMAQVQKWRGRWPDTGKPLAPEEWAITRAFIKGETTINQEVEVEFPEGQRKVILDSGVPIREEQGRIIGGAAIHQDITERKRLEEALRASERRAANHASELEVIFAAMTDGVFVYDAEGRILRHNTAARQIFGFDAQPDVVSLPFNARASRYAPLDEHGQSFPIEHLALNRILRGEVLTSSHAADEHHHTLDGRKLSISITGAPLHDAGGALTGAVAIVRDVTERRQLEREVAERAAQLEAIFESIADGLIVTDCQGRVLHMNQAIRTLLGIEQDLRGFTMSQIEEIAEYSVCNAQGQPLTDAERPISRYLQGEVLTRQQSVDLILHTRAGREIGVNVGGAPIRDETGHILGAVEVIRDVTEHRRLEQHTHHTLNALLAMAEALVQAPNQTPAAPEDTAPRDPPVARRLAELTRSVLGCQYVSMAAVEPGTETLTPLTVVGLSPEDEQQWWASWNPQPYVGDGLQLGALAAPCTDKSVLLERAQPPLPICQYVTPEHKSIIVPMRVGETLVGVLRLDDGAQEDNYTCPNRQALIRAVARLGALVVERERLLRERAEARASELALRETNAHMDAFLGMAGHELKTPLTSVKLALQLAERRIHRLVQCEKAEGADLAPFLEQVARAEHQTDRLDRLVNDLLDVSRVRAGKLELHPEPADLAAIIREAVEEQRQAASDRRLSLQLSADQHILVTADTDRIGQVVTNYLTNALKYSPVDRPIHVGLAMDGQHARVWVRDEGPGLPAEEQEHIWERFHRVKGIEVQSGSGAGLGLGLHICQTIVERHQGQVGVESAPGQGSTFWFTLPLAS